ncbi:MAG: NUDIX domain-containing protein [Deltaproteobacteria bacterium]|nr:NUDIX domain-containing protein [Deltaproteobacteria bacterium]
MRRPTSHQQGQPAVNAEKQRTRERPLVHPWRKIYRNESLEEAVKRILSMETGLQPTSITQVSTMSHIWPELHAITTYYKVDVDTDKVKPDQQHRDHRWINRMEDELHPYIKEMIETANIFRE